MTGLLIPSFFLTLFGSFNIFGIKPNLFLPQLAFFVIGLVVFFTAKKIGRNFFFSNAEFFYWFFIVLLIATFIIGFEVKGSKRWIDLIFFNFQSSEFLKVFFIIFFAKLFSRKFFAINSLEEFLKSLFYFLLPTLIIFKQPDLGNAMVYTFIFIVMLLFSKIPKRYVVYLFIIAILVAPIGLHFLKGYQKERISSFFNPQLDTQGNAYNMTQAVITVGSGKFLGRGLGLGTQSRLYFLPENYTDFAFASLVEQFGFVGGFIILLLYFIISLAIFRNALNYFYKDDEDSRQKFFYSIGFLSFFIFQMAINIGMNMGMFPITGIALPFISYGGSSLVSLLLGMSILP